MSDPGAGATAATMILVSGLTIACAKSTPERLDAYLDEHLESDFSGAMMMIADEQTILARGFGMANRERSVANSLATVFPFGVDRERFHPLPGARTGG